MPLWPLPTTAKRRAVTRTATSVQYTTLTSSASANVKGAWAQLTASCPVDAKALYLRGNGFNATGVASPGLVDIAVGGSGSELIVFPDLDVGFTPANASWIVPCDIAAGQRVAARLASPRTSTTLQIVADFLGEVDIAGGPAGVAAWATYGVDAGNSRGAAVTPGNSSAWGSWAQLGTTSADHDVWLARADMGGNSNTTAVNYRAQMAFAPDATAASLCATNGTHLELPQAFAVTTSEVLNQYHYDDWGLYAPVPAGTPIWCRATCSGTAQTIYVVAYGGK